VGLLETYGIDRVRVASGPLHPLDDGLQVMEHTHLPTGESKKGVRDKFPQK
jgi:hypothetical protein